jgi:hypothetical protein
MDDLDELDDVIEEPQDTTIEDTTKDDGTE